MKSYFVVLKVKRKRLMRVHCCQCGFELGTKNIGQFREFDRKKEEYKVYNHYKCGNCGYEFKEKEIFIPSYTEYPRLDQKWEVYEKEEKYSLPFLPEISAIGYVTECPEIVGIEEVKI
jgi:predicted Zn-ribbon and HTH transcriptional regulator